MAAGVTCLLRNVGPTAGRGPAPGGPSGTSPLSSGSSGTSGALRMAGSPKELSAPESSSSKTAGNGSEHPVGLEHQVGWQQLVEAHGGSPESSREHSPPLQLRSAKALAASRWEHSSLSLGPGAGIWRTGGIHSTPRAPEPVPADSRGTAPTSATAAASAPSGSVARWCSTGPVDIDTRHSAAK